MPQPKQSTAPSKAPVRGDATATPAPATAPAKSTKAAVAGNAPREKAPAEGLASPTAAGESANDPAASRPAPPAPAVAPISAPKPPAPITAPATPKAPAASKPAAAKPAAKKASSASKPTAVAKKPTPRKPAAKKAAAASKPTAAAKRPAAKKPAATAKPKAAPKRAAAPKRPAAAPAPAPEPTSSAARDEALRANLASLRDLLAGGVVLTAQRLQEAVDEAVTRGRITRRDAEELASAMLAAGRQQTADLVADLEQLLGRGLSDLTSASSVKGAVKESSDRMLREVDRARRSAGIGPSFPILGYDDLKAKQIVARLAELSKAELRTVREHERRNADRSAVLKAIKKALS